MFDFNYKKDYFGRLNANRIKRPGTNDPDFTGWVDFKNGRASIAAWALDDLELPGEKKLSISIRPWAKGRKVYTYGGLQVNLDRRAHKAPEMLGKAAWSALDYSLAAWLIEFEDKFSHINLTARILGRSDFNVVKNQGDTE